MQLTSYIIIEQIMDNSICSIILTLRWIHTYTALEEVAGALEKNGIETEIIQVGVEPIAGCIGCGACLKTGKCFRETASMNL